MIEFFQEPVAFFLLIMAVILVTPLLSERLHLPGIVGIILGGVLIGPYGLKLLQVGERIEFLATIGLVYLMFNAGLEVDLHQFRQVGRRALVFGILTFSLPQLFGMLLGWFLGLEWLGMILLGSAFSSHTLIAFPIITRLGVTRNEAVAITAGATVLTDISAFIVLAVVLGSQTGDLQVGYFLQLLLSLAIFTLFITLFVPRLGKYFLRRFSGRAVEFQFILVVLFVAALTAELIGVHQVVGAFLAGLAINATLPHHSPVAGHVLFMGESLFIPIFLLYSGMITNPWVFLAGWQTLLTALGVVFVAYSSKFLAAWLTTRIFAYSRAEFWTAFGLSHAQAAVTIPTLVIGMQIGLFDETLFNAAIVMILLTSITSPLIVQRSAAGLLTQRPPTAPGSIFSRILTPIANPHTQAHLLTLANLLARTCQGKVLVLHVAQEIRGQVTGLDHQRQLLERVPEILADPESEVELLPRVAHTFAQGILHTALERQATLILIGWRGKRKLAQNILGTVLDEVVWGAHSPVLVAKVGLPLNSTRRVILLLPTNAASPDAVRRFLHTTLAVAQALNVPLQVQADQAYQALLHDLLHHSKSDVSHSLEAFRDPFKLIQQGLLDQTDLVIIPGFGSRKRFISSIGNLPERLAASLPSNLLILHYDH